MGRRAAVWSLYAILLVLPAACSEHNAVVDSGGADLPVRYIAIDIDDIFQPNWDPVANKIGTVKMNADDVRSLIKLAADIRSEFGSQFKFTIGYNSAYYDSACSGDRAFIENRQEFNWFSHLPRHQHVQEALYSAAKIESLIDIDRNFALNHGITLSPYMVTPLHDGIWPPYVPLYDAFEKYHIQYTSSDRLTSRASYGDVNIIPRHYIGVGSSTYSLSQVGTPKLADFTQKDFKVIKQEPAIIFYTHQSNFAQDHVGEILIRMILQKLREQKEYRIVFVPAEQLGKIVFSTPLAVHKTPGQ